MGLCLSICDIGVIMKCEGLGGWEGIRRWTQMDADERRGAGDWGAGGWEFHTSHFTLHTFLWHAKIFEPFRFFVRNVEHCCTNTAKGDEAGW